MKDYHVALSFAGEQREYVEKVANLLIQKNIKVFYDKHVSSNSWNKNLYDYFGKIYLEKSHLIVLFVSKDYVVKEIPKHEAKSAQSNPHNIVFVAKFDDSKLEGENPHNLYLDIKSMEEAKVADFIIEKLVEKGVVFNQSPCENTYSKKCTNISTPEIKISIFDAEEHQISYQSACTIVNGLRSASQKSLIFDNLDEEKVYGIYCADPRYPRIYIENISVGTEVKVKFPNQMKKIGSLFGSGRINIPNLDVEINPIIDNSNRKYFYGSNINCNGLSTNPYYFKYGEELVLEKYSRGIGNIRILHGIKSNLFLIEYISLK